MKIVIVIPTYNEANNVDLFIPALFMTLKADANPGREYHALVVDANSPDCTADVVRGKMSEFPNVHLLVEEKKRGLGAAYIDAFQYVLKSFDADVVIEMDADFQHNPKDVIRLVDEIDKGNDYIIGSRFVKGGSIPSNWAFYRKILSIGGNIFSKVVLGIFSVSDFTSGFKATRVKGFLDKINFNEVLSGGFAYKMDLLFKMYKMNAGIKEIPISFGLRDRGSSKMEKDNFFDSLKVVLLIRYNQNKSFFRFILVGFAGLFADAGTFNILRLTLLNSGWAAVFSGLIGMITTFTLNNVWSFGDRKITSRPKQVFSFIVYIFFSSFPIWVRKYIIEYATTNMGDTFLVSNTAFFIGVMFGLIWNFVVYSKIIWKQKVNL